MTSPAQWRAYPAAVRNDNVVNARPKMFARLARIAAIEPPQQAGEIFAVATILPGIGFAHTGLCFKEICGIDAPCSCRSSQ